MDAFGLSIRRFHFPLKNVRFQVGGFLSSRWALREGREGRRSKKERWALVPLVMGRMSYGSGARKNREDKGTAFGFDLCSLF